MTLKYVLSGMVPLLRVLVTLIAIPAALFGVMYYAGFRYFNERSMQAECKLNLRALVVAERDFFMKERRYSEHTSDLYLSVEHLNRYAYFLGSSGPLEDRSGPWGDPIKHAGDVGIGADGRWASNGPTVTASDLPTAFAGGHQLGVEGTCPDCEITLACAGRIWIRPIDIWSISTVARMQDGKTIPPETPFHETGGPPQPGLGERALALLMPFWAVGSIVLKAMALNARRRGPLYQGLFSFLFYGFLVLGCTLLAAAALSLR
jgi:hypothetical protein